MEIVEDKALLFKTRNPDKFKIIPKHKIVRELEGGAEIAVYWGLDEVRVLRNLGIKDVPSPITKRYKWPGRYAPMQHQIETASFLTMHRRAFVFSEPGTGKTLSALWAADYLMTLGKVRRVLILCPLSIMHSAWMGDINNSIIHRSAVVAHHAQAARRIELIQHDYEIVIANYEGLNLIANEINADGRFDLVIVDECFVAGTLVSTPQGRRPIEQLEAGDKVLTSDGVMRIKRLVRNMATKLVEVTLGNGQTIRCTPEHPFFTDAGWVCAKNLAGRRLISGVELSCLRAGISPREIQSSTGAGEQPTSWTGLLKILRTEEVAFSESQQERLLQLAARATGEAIGAKNSGASSEAVGSGKSQGAQTPNTWGQWDRHDADGAVDFRGIACGVGMELPGSVGPEAARLSYELQARLRMATPQGRVGSGRWQPHGGSTPSAGLQEGNEVGGAWVVGVSHIECPDGEAVFNLEVEGTPNYFVGDYWLVHNCNAYKTVTTQRWKALASIVKPETYLWMMTGTPASQSPVDAYGLAKLVNPEGVPKFFTAWRDKVMNKVTMYKWAPKITAKDEVFNALQPAIRFTKAQCLDLPPVMTMTRFVEMTPQQKKYYALLKERLLVQAAGETISAVNAAAAVSKLLQISCIAYNTPVLTQHGWVPICTVTAADLVWDGEYWVRCGGAVFKGTRQTLVLDGVRLTPEHLVWTSDGWQQAGDCENGYASKRFNRTKVRLPDGFGEGGYIQREDEEGTVALPMRLRGSSGAGIPKLAFCAPTKPKALRLSARGICYNAWADLDQTVQNMVGYAPEMLKSKGQGLQKLRSAWNNGVQTLGKFIREFLGGHAGGVCRHSYVGPQEREQGLQQSELSMGNSAGAGQQHTIQPRGGHPEGAHDRSTSGNSVRNKTSDALRPTDTLRLAAEQSTNNAGEIAVFDIINCGPRNRFVVRGDNGAHLIVHNCGAAYTDDKEVVEFDASPRLSVLEEVLEETERKVIIFALFTSAIDTIHRHLTKRNITADIIDGSVSATKRAQIIHRFQNDPDPRVLVMQPQASAHGITLTAADTVVFYGPLMSVEQYIQCCARADRKGQTSDKVTVVHIESSPIETKMFKALSGKVTDNAMLVTLFDTEVRRTKNS